MSLGTLLNNADCGPSNPLQQLSKRLDTDRGIQQVTDSSSFVTGASISMYTDRNSHIRVIRIILERAEQGHPARYCRPPCCMYNSTDPTTGIPPVSSCRSISPVRSGPILLSERGTPCLRPQRAFGGVTAAENTGCCKPALQRSSLGTPATGSSAA